MMTAPARALTMFAKALSNSSGPRTWTICSGTFCPGGHFRFSDELRGRSVITVCEDSHAGGSRDDHPEKVQPFPSELRGHARQPRRVPARPHEACYEPAANWIGDQRHDNGDRLAQAPNRQDRVCIPRDDDVYR